MTRREAVALALGSWVMSGVGSSVAFARGPALGGQGAPEGLTTLPIRDLVERIGEGTSRRLTSSMPISAASISSTRT